MRGSRSDRRYDLVKRAFDVVVSASLVIATAPVQLAVASLIAARLGRPVLFRQPRSGRDGTAFVLVKFRTMLPIDESRGVVSDEARLTRLGKLLRSTSLDELPTLWNVLRGDMSLVGPRPLLVEYLELYTPEQSRRHEVRPGITGLAQVSGRNALSWERKLRLDVRYVDRCSPSVDLRILVRTVGAVLARRGIAHEGHVTMERFGGSDGA